METTLRNIIHRLVPTCRRIRIDTCSTNGNWYVCTLFYSNNTYSIISLREVQSQFGEERIENMIREKL